jgi:DNA invertase Pin-like site-specific DNA recombinase
LFFEVLQATSILHLAKAQDKRRRASTRTSSGKAVFHMLGVFAEFERAMIQERVRAGLARAGAERIEGAVHHG